MQPQTKTELAEEEPFPPPPRTDASLLTSLRSLPRGAYILFLGTFLNKFGSFVVPFLAIYMTRLGYTNKQAGLAIGAYGFGSLGAALMGGHLADRLGRRKTIVLSMFSGAAAMLCLSQARSLPMILGFSALVGLTGELYRPAGNALLADLVPAGQRVTAYAAYRLAFNAGWAFGPATAGFLAKRSFLWLFVGDAATSVLYGLIAWWALPAGLTTLRSGSPLGETLRVLREDKRLLRVICAVTIVGFLFVQAFSTMSVQITQSGFSSSTYGVMISLNGALVVLCELPLTTLTKHRPARLMMALGFTLIGLGFASNLLARTLPTLTFTTGLFTLGEMLSLPIASAYVADLAPTHERGLYMGAYSLTWSLAFIGGSSLGMMIFSVSPVALWSLCGLLGLAAGAIILGAKAESPRITQITRMGETV